MSWPSTTRQLLVLTGLTGFAISQPLLSVLGDAPTELASYGVGGRELVALACLVAFAPPLLLFVITWVAGRGSARLGRSLHLLLVALLAGLLVIQIAKGAGVGSSVALAGLAVVAGGGFAVAYVRFAAVATWAGCTAILPFLAVGSFLLVSPASDLRASAAVPERVTGADLPSVVLVILDELPTRSLLDGGGGIDPVRYPNLAGFAADATWYRHSSSLATLTEAAVPSMLTGTLPVAEEAVWTNHPGNLFTLLAPTHELEVIEQGTELCPYDVCVPTAAGGDAAPLDLGGPGFGDLLGVTRDLWIERVSLGAEPPPAFDDFVEEVAPDGDATTTSTTSAPTSPSVTARPEPEDRVTPAEGSGLVSVRTDAMVDSFDRDKGPALYYLHLMVPHQPFNRYADGTEYRVHDPYGEGLPDEDSKVIFSWSPWVSAVSEQRHLLQVQYGDQLVGQVLDGLREAGLYDDSLVIVASDHGISFEARTEGRYVEPSTTDALAYAPLLVKAPGQTEGTVDDSNVMSYDVLPTIADILGLDVAWEIDGAPVGSEAVASRGPAKQIYDMIGFGGLRIDEIVDFDDGVAFPTVGDRFIGALTDPDDPLSALHAHLGLDGSILGARLDDLVTSRSGSLTVDYLGDLLRPPADRPPTGMVAGDVDAPAVDGDDAAVVVLAVDGVVVTGSALSTTSSGDRGRVVMLLPRGAIDDDNDIRAALLVDDEVVELSVR